MTPGFGGTQRLPRLIGEGLATELILTGSNITAQRGEQISVFNHVVNASELMTEAVKITNTINNNTPLAVKIAKDIEDGLSTNLKLGMKQETLGLAQCLISKDGKEGVDAFINKRPAKYLGR